MVQLMPLPLTVSYFSKIQIGFTFLVPAHLGSPGKGPLNGCVLVDYVNHHLLLHLALFDAAAIATGAFWREFLAWNIDKPRQMTKPSFYVVVYFGSLLHVC